MSLMNLPDDQSDSYIDAYLVTAISYDLSLIMVCMLVVCLPCLGEMCFRVQCCCSRFSVSVDEGYRGLPVSHIYRQWRSSLSSEFVTMAHVLLELISAREGAFCLSEFDDIIVRVGLTSIGN